MISFGINIKICFWEVTLIFARIIGFKEFNKFLIGVELIPI